MRKNANWYFINITTFFVLLVLAVSVTVIDTGYGVKREQRDGVVFETEEPEIPFDVTTPSVIAQVSNWAQFLAAMNNSAINVVELTADITDRSSTAGVALDTTNCTKLVRSIAGSRFTVDMKAYANTISSSLLGTGVQGFLVLQNINYINTGASLINITIANNSANWNIWLHNIQTAQPTAVNQRGAINAVQATVKVFGDDNILLNEHGTSRTVEAENFYMAEGAKLTCGTRLSTSGASYAILAISNEITIADGCELTAENRGTTNGSTASTSLGVFGNVSSFVIGGYSAVNIVGRENGCRFNSSCEFSIGAHSELNIEQLYSSAGSATAALYMNASGSISVGDNSIVTVSGRNGIGGRISSFVLETGAECYIDAVREGFSTLNVPTGIDICDNAVMRIDCGSTSGNALVVGNSSTNKGAVTLGEGALMSIANTNGSGISGYADAIELGTGATLFVNASVDGITSTVLRSFVLGANVECEIVAGRTGLSATGVPTGVDVGDNAVMRIDCGSTSGNALVVGNSSTNRGAVTLGERAVMSVTNTNGSGITGSIYLFDVGADAELAVQTTDRSIYSTDVACEFIVGDSAVVTAESTGSNPTIQLGSSAADSAQILVCENAEMIITNSGSSHHGASGSGANTGSNGISGYIAGFTQEPNSYVAIDAYNSAMHTPISMSFTLKHGAVMDASSKQTGALIFGPYGDVNTSNVSHELMVGDEHGAAELNVYTEAHAVNPSWVSGELGYSLSSTSEYYVGCMVVNGDGSRMELKNGSTVNAVSVFDTVLYIRGTGSELVVGDRSVLNLTAGASTYEYMAALRFAFTGGNSFTIDGGEVNIERQVPAHLQTSSNDQRAPGIRMYATGTAIAVINGGRLNIHNTGNGVAHDGNDNGGNQGIHAVDTGSGTAITLIVDGSGSRVEIRADSGPAIRSQGDFVFTVSGGTELSLTGRTNSYDVGALHCVGMLQLTGRETAYFNLRNNRSGGTGNSINGYAVRGNANSVIDFTDSVLEVWQRGTDMDGYPTYSWGMSDFTLKGSNLAATNSSLSDELFKDVYNQSTGTDVWSGSNNYSRICANNSLAVVDELRTPTDADKYIWGHVSIPEGFGGGFRNARTGEVLIQAIVRNENGDEIFCGEGFTVGIDENNPQGVSVYGEAPRGGIFCIPYTPNDSQVPELLPAGYTVEIIPGTAYEISYGMEEENEAVTVTDITPPGSAVVKSAGAGGRTIEGAECEPGAIVTIAFINPITSELEWIAEGGGTRVTAEADENGDWVFVLPEDVTLVRDDVLQVFLTDSAGNRNPEEDVEYHDAIFPMATIVTVNDMLLTLHIRQVVMMSEDNVRLREVPRIGFAVANNGSNGSVNMLMASGSCLQPSNDIGFALYTIEGIWDLSQFEVDTIIPQFFRYCGYRITETLQEQQAYAVTSGAIEITSDSAVELWLTIFLEPITEEGYGTRDILGSYQGR